jgi:DNA-binding NarL/FixJ family response regulator
MCVSQAGEPKWINVTIAVPKGQRRGASILHVFRDVSDRRRTEEFALRASKALRELLSEDGPDTSEAADPRLPLPRLSRRELEVLRLLAVGMKTREIAKALGVQPVTARNHITRLLTKLGVENRLQAVIYASDRKII